MTAPARGVRHATVLTKRHLIARQINEAQEPKKPLVFDLESEAKNPSVLTFELWEFVPMGDEDLIVGISATQEEVTVRIPHDPEKPATAVLPL